MTEGSKVTYTYKDTVLHGVIKRFHDDYRFAFVVFHCDNNWEEYENYTASLCLIKNLKPGWI